MVNKILIDTNVLLDYLLEREPFFDDAKKIMVLCTNRKVKGCIAAHTIPNMFFILRKDFNVKERREDLQTKASQTLRIACRRNAQRHMEQITL